MPNPSTPKHHPSSPKHQSTASGIVLVDKPGGITSHDVVARTRRLAGTRKVGHAGTLDPLATGLLILGVNSSTRLLTYVVGLDKEYLATVRLGAATTTDDSEGEFTTTAAPDAVAALDLPAIAAAFAQQQGTITQVPSSVSAIKVDGRRAYARVRAGEEVVLAGRTVTISEIELLGDPRATTDGGHPFIDIDVRIVCSSGTYIRAIARDVGSALGVGGHLTSLRRTRIGPFAVSAARTLEQLAAVVDSGALLPMLSPADAARRLFPVLEVDTAQTVALGHGQRIAVPDAPHTGTDISTSTSTSTGTDISTSASPDDSSTSASPDDSSTSPDTGNSAAPGSPSAAAPETDDNATSAGPFAAITPEGRLLGLVEVTGGRGKSIVNFPPDEYAGADT